MFCWLFIVIVIENEYPYDGTIYLEYITFHLFSLYLLVKSYNMDKGHGSKRGPKIFNRD